MTRIDRLVPQFVDSIPATLDPGTLYISMTYGTAQHLCCCGCGNEVVTPIHPSYWTLIWDGATASLHPSVGNWSLPCRSHYFISGNDVRWARQWSHAEIEAVRQRDRDDVAAYFDEMPDNERSQPRGRRPLRLLRRLGRHR